MGKNDVRFGDNVFLAPHVSIYTAEHPIDAEIRNTEVEYAQSLLLSGLMYGLGGLWLSEV